MKNLSHTVDLFLETGFLDMLLRDILQAFPYQSVLPRVCLATGTNSYDGRPSFIF